MKSLKSVPFATLSLALAVPPAFGQTADDSSSAGGGTSTTEEIVVTAEKRSSTIQDTPLSISARSGVELQQSGITDLTGVIHEIPGISVRTAGPGQTELEMRGLSSSGGAAPTVGYYLNDYPLSPPAAALVGKVVVDPDLFDLDRVEVLRGPQGTLYGSGSMGGTVKLVTNAPTLDQFNAAVQGIASGTDGGGFNRGGNVMLNLPLMKDVAALRLVFTEKITDGFVDRQVVSPFPAPVNPLGLCNLPTAIWPGCTRGDLTGLVPSQTVTRSNREQLTGGRAELVVDPTDRLRVEGLVMLQRIRANGYSEYDDPPGSSAGLIHYQPFNLSEPFSDDFRLFGATVTYDLNFAKLTSATEYYSRTEDQSQDDSEALYSFFPQFGLPAQFLPIPFNETDGTRQLSEEIRLTSSDQGPWQWIAGAYYANFESTFGEYSASASLANLLTNPLGIIYQAHNPYHMKQYAVFGESSYEFTNHVKLTAGLRWYQFRSHADEEVSGIATGTGNGTQQLGSFDASNSGVNPKVTLSYEPNRRLTIYGTAARGFRPGGINQQIPASLCTLTAESYGPDSTWNFEVGEKAKLFDNRVKINADFYYIKWSDVQQTVNQACGYPLTVNAGDAESYGPEVEIGWRVTPRLTANLSGTYTHAELTSVPASLTATTGLTDGTTIINVPKYTAMASLNYTRPLWDDKKLSVRFSDSYVGTSRDIAFTSEQLASYSLLAARIGLAADNWSVYVFGDNLANKHAELGVNTSSFAFQAPSLVRVATNQPRTIGADLTYHF